MPVIQFLVDIILNRVEIVVVGNKPGIIQRFVAQVNGNNIIVAVHVRIESGVENGSVVTPYFDSMIAKIIVHGSDRSDVIAKTLEAAQEFNLVGLKTTVPFCRAVLQHPEFVSARYTTRWVEQYFTPEMLETEDEEMVGALAATIIYATELLQLTSVEPSFKNDDVNVWVLNKRINKI